MTIIFTNTAIYDNKFLLFNQHLMGNTTMTINKPITILELGPAQPQLVSNTLRNIKKKLTHLIT